jgi:hypothetical protein
MVNAVRRYRNPNRHDNQYIYRSVTNVTGALPKPALVAWAAKLTAETAVEQLESWRNMPAMEAVDWLKGTPWRTRDRAAARGTTVHAVVDNMINGLTYEVESLTEPWIMAATKFVQEARPRPERTETSVYDERSYTAGTFDFLGRLDAAPELGRVLIDWKTGKGIYADMAVQLVGGYALGAQYILDDDGNEIEWRRPDAALLVHLTQDGYAIRRVPMEQQLRRAFLGALEIRRWEDEGPGVEQPYQLRLDVDGGHFSTIPTEAELAHLRSCLQQLSHEQQLTLSARCTERGIPTKRSQMTVDHVDVLLSWIGQLVDEKEPPPSRPTRRPMP